MSPRPARPRPRARSVALVAAATTFTTLGAAGCASVTVKPSEREVLSRRELDPATEDERLESEWESHVESARDYSAGGHGAAGGGCGCG